MAKTKFWDMKSMIVSLKAVGVSIITGLIFILPMALARYVITIWNMPIVGMILGLLTLAGYIYTWGWLARKFWSWK